MAPDLLLPMLALLKPSGKDFYKYYVHNKKYFSTLAQNFLYKSNEKVYRSEIAPKLFS
jgi:hypothetical protein